MVTVRTIRRVLLVLLAAAAFAVWWLGSSAAVPATSAFWLAQPDSLDELRRAAAGVGPRELRVGVIGGTAVPGWFNTAWGGFGSERRVFITLQLVYPDGHIMIDAPFGADTHRAIVGASAPFYPGEFARMQHALATADSILLTHVHRDHLGGLVDSRDPRGLLSRTEVTPEQKAGFRRVHEVELGDPSTLGFDLDDFDDLTRIHDFSRLKRMAPGVVAVKTPGHTPGHLIYFIRTTDGREVLFVGDLVWSYRNVEVGRSRPRAIAEYFLGDDSAAVADQLRALMTFADTNPEVEIIVAHDAERLERQIERGVLRAGLQD